MFRMLRHLSVYVAVSVILSTTGYIVFPLQSPGWPWRLSQGPPRLGKGSKIPPQ